MNPPNCPADSRGTLRRVLVVGASGAGKTTLARELSGILGMPTTDLDALFWAPGWARVPTEEFRACTLERARGDEWIIAGNFFGQVLWSRADIVVWLDLPRRLSFFRMAVRTVVQAARREELFHGCRQSLWSAWRDGLFRTSWRESVSNRTLIPELLTRPEFAHLEPARLRSRAEVAAWLASIER